MLLNIIRKNINDFFTAKIWIAVVVFSMFVLYIIPNARHFNISYYEFILIALNDHYYILYFMTITFIFFIFKLIKNNEEILLIRTKKYINFFTAQIISLILISILFVLLHLIIVMIIGYGLKMQNAFTLDNSVLNRFEIIKIYNSYYNTPITGIAISTAYMISGLIFLGTLIMFIKNYIKAKSTIIGVIVIYLLMLFSIRTEIDNIVPYVFINNYIILHHSFVVLNKSYYMLLICELFLIVSILILIRYFWYKRISFNKYSVLGKSINKIYLSNLFSRKNLLIIITLTLILVLSVIFRYDNLTFNDLLLLQFYGHGIGYFRLIDFLMLIIYNGIPIYLLCCFLDEESRGRSFSVTIRLKSKKKWIIAIVRSAFLFIFAYLLISIICTIIISFITGMDFKGYNYTRELFLTYNLKIINPYYLYFIILSAKSIELLLYFMIIFTVFNYKKGVTISFASLQLAYCLYFFDIDFAKYLPVGMASLSRISEFAGNKGIPYILVMAILIMTNSLLYLTIRKTTRI